MLSIGVIPRSERAPRAQRRAVVADARLASEYHSLKRWLMGILRQRYRLADEDSEEIADDALLAWHREMCTAGGVRNDRAFCAAVGRSRAIDRARRKTVQTVALGEVENVGVDPQVDALLAEREELRDLHEVAREVLQPREYAIVRLVASGVPRTVVANRFGLRLRQVKRVRERAGEKLEVARAQLEEQGRCGMVALTIANINGGVIGPGDPRWTVAVEHLARCWRCRHDRNGIGDHLSVAVARRALEDTALKRRPGVP